MSQLNLRQSPQLEALPSPNLTTTNHTNSPKLALMNYLEPTTSSNQEEYRDLLLLANFLSGF